jgi:hypothetical protein
VGQGLIYRQGVGTADDPEKMLADALRAQAAQTRAPEPPPTSPVFELLSGNEFGMNTRREPEAPAATTRLPQARLSSAAVLLLALVLGLACGAVAGLLTVL